MHQRLPSVRFRLFPDSDTANLNAAASALKRKDAASTARYLGRVKVHDATYRNNMGILSWLEGDRAKAAEYFIRSGGHGAENAAKIL